MYGNVHSGATPPWLIPDDAGTSTTNQTGVIGPTIDDLNKEGTEEIHSIIVIIP